MSLDALIMLCGALVAFLASVAGFPPSIYKPLFFILGVIVVGLGIIVRRQRGERETAERLAAQAGSHTQSSQHVSDQRAPLFSHEENELAR